MLATTLALTIGLASAGTAYDPPPKDPVAAVIFNFAGMPLLLGPGGGYLYAGDPWRGLWVTGGFWGAIYGGALAVGVAENIPVWLTATSGHPLSIVDSATPMLGGAFLGGAAYLIWAGFDVFQTTERINHEQKTLFPR
jgi:hypothetical protein